MSKKWKKVSEEIPDNESIGTFFEIEWYNSESSIKTRGGYYVVTTTTCGKKLIDIEDGEKFPLISNWIYHYNRATCLRDKWRYITKNEMMAFL